MTTDQRHGHLLMNKALSSSDQIPPPMHRVRHVTQPASVDRRSRLERKKVMVIDFCSVLVPSHLSG